MDPLDSVLALDDTLVIDRVALVELALDFLLEALEARDLSLHTVVELALLGDS